MVGFSWNYSRYSTCMTVLLLVRAPITLCSIVVQFDGISCKVDQLKLVYCTKIPALTFPALVWHYIATVHTIQRIEDGYCPLLFQGWCIWHCIAPVHTI
ncbi:hypothetical protein TRVA0_015S01728 [Trichomonascus vanleenenianus]|uniref:uncharacterized protein n=1 Tax=Trichomonascus vanleenenianus TaxID=2268995 RepID=UPI003ECAB0DB